MKMHEFNAKKILIVFMSGIGNFLLFLPTLRAIRRMYPNAFITLCLKQAVLSDLIDNEQIVDQIISYPCNICSFDSFKAAFLFLRKERKHRYDISVTTFDASGWKLAVIMKVVAARIRIGFRTGKWFDACFNHLLTYDRSVHEMDRHWTIAEFLGRSHTKKEFTLRLTEDEIFLANMSFSKDPGVLVGVHPGSSELLMKKRWPIGKFAKLIDRIYQDYHAQILILGGETEQALAKELCASAQLSKPMDMTGDTSIRQAAALIKMCKIFISNDSGLMHLAAAVGTPVIAVFGPTDPVKNAPYGKTHIVVRNNVQCSPCYTYDKNYRCNVECLQGISVSDVMMCVDRMIESISLSMNNNQNMRHTCEHAGD